MYDERLEAEGKPLNNPEIRRSAVNAIVMWPELVAPPMYDNPDPRWEDPKLPDLRLIWKVAREVGYAVGVHGSLKRDFDLIAAPWTKEAVGQSDFIRHMCKGLGAIQLGKLELKPFGRYAVTLQLDGFYKHIDLSVMPNGM